MFKKKMVFRQVLFQRHIESSWKLFRALTQSPYCVSNHLIHNDIAIFSVHGVAKAV